LASPPISVWRRDNPIDSWATWRAFLTASQGEPLTAAEAATFAQFTGGRVPPTAPCREQIYVLGRRAGKDASTAVKAVYLATCADYPELAQGERGTLLIIAPDTSQAAIQLGYIRGVLEGSALLIQRITSQTSDTISLDNGVDITVRASSFRRLRGLTCIAIIASESAFWLSENSSNPDTEILRAVRPALLTTGGPLIQISTPYARKGELWNAYHRYFGKDGPTLVVSAPSLAFNPTLDKAEIDRAYAEDPESASAEYGGEFRNAFRPSSTAPRSSLASTRT
jgi:hypothetical protein